MTDRFRNGDPSNDQDSVPGKPDWWQGGDLQGVIDELDYIKGLGFTAIWITPVTAQTTGGYHGYWTADFYAVDPHLGDLATLRRLVATAHQKGLKVVLDVVLNHVGYGHPWLRDGAHDGWFHEPCGISYSSQRSIEQCWLAGLPDLNTEDPRVRAYLTDWSLWLIRETAVDGFRLDTARHLPKDFLREWSSAVKREFPRFWIIGEVFSSDYRYQADYLQSGLDAVTDFQTYDGIRMGLARNGDLSRLSWTPPLAASWLPRPDARLTFIDNHDVPRFIGPSDPDPDTVARLEQAIVYLFTMPGTPALYYGTEVGLSGGQDPSNRKPMPWQEPPHPEVRSLVARAASLRAATPALRGGGYVELRAEQSLYAYARTLGGDAILVALNGDPDHGAVARIDLASLAPLAGDAGITADPLIGGSVSVTARDGALALDVPPQGATVWRLRRPTAPPWAFILAGVVAAAAIAAGAYLFSRRARSRPRQA
jgi:alpha-amylase